LLGFLFRYFSVQLRTCPGGTDLPRFYCGLWIRSTLEVFVRHLSVMLRYDCRACDPSTSPRPRSGYSSNSSVALDDLKIEHPSRPGFDSSPLYDLCGLSSQITSSSTQLDRVLAYGTSRPPHQRHHLVPGQTHRMALPAAREITEYDEYLVPRTFRSSQR